MTAGRVRVVNRQSEFFARVPHALIDSDASSHVIALYTALARLANFTTGETTEFDIPTTSRVMELARIGRRDNFTAARDWLVERGYLAVTEHAGKPCEYAVHDGPDPCAIAHDQSVSTPARPASGTPAHPAQGSSDRTSSVTRDLETSAARGAAERVVRAHWDRCKDEGVPTPTVRSASARRGSRGTPFIGLVKMVEGFIDAGHSEQALASALWNTHTFTIAALTLQLRRQSLRGNPQDAIAEWLARSPQEAHA